MMKLLDESEKPEDFPKHVKKQQTKKTGVSEDTSFTSQNFSIQFLQNRSNFIFFLIKAEVNLI